MFGALLIMEARLESDIRIAYLLSLLIHIYLNCIVQLINAFASSPQTDHSITPILQMST